MINFVIMFVCLIAGAVIRRGAKLAIRDVRPLNAVILWMSLPAVVLTQIPALVRAGGVTSDLAVAVAMPWCNFVCAFVAVALMGRAFGWSRSVIGALALTAGLGNTSFVGLPVIETLFGDHGVQIAILLDQLGSFLILATLGLLVASIYAGRDLSVMTVVKRVFTFPPFIAIVLAIAWGFSSLPIQGIGVDALKKIGATLVPLALLSVGWQLDLNSKTLRQYAAPLTIGLVFKLLLWPLAVVTAIGHSGLVTQVTSIEAAMPTMITSAVVAADFELESELAQLMVGLSIPLSVLTLWTWATLLKLI